MSDFSSFFSYRPSGALKGGKKPRFRGGADSDSGCDGGMIALIVVVIVILLIAIVMACCYGYNYNYSSSQKVLYVDTESGKVVGGAAARFNRKLKPARLDTAQAEAALDAAKAKVAEYEAHTGGAAAAAVESAKANAQAYLDMAKGRLDEIKGMIATMEGKSGAKAADAAAYMQSLASQAQAAVDKAKAHVAELHAQGSGKAKAQAAVDTARAKVDQIKTNVAEFASTLKGKASGVATSAASLIQLLAVQAEGKLQAAKAHVEELAAQGAGAAHAKAQAAVDAATVKVNELKNQLAAVRAPEEVKAHVAEAEAALQHVKAKLAERTAAGSAEARAALEAAKAHVAMIRSQAEAQAEAVKSGAAAAAPAAAAHGGAAAAAAHGAGAAAAAAAPRIHSLSSEEELMAKLRGRKPVVVFIHMDGCGFCNRAHEQVFTPYLAMRHPYVELCDINVRHCQRFCEHYKIDGFPVFVTNYEQDGPKFHMGFKSPEIMDRIIAAARARGMRAVVSPQATSGESTDSASAPVGDMSAEEAMALLQSKKQALVAVVAPWCGFCKKLKEEKVLEKLKAAFPQLTVGFVDGTKAENKALVDKLSAESGGSFGFPTLVHTLAPEGGKMYEIVSGYRPFQALRDVIASKIAAHRA